MWLATPYATTTKRYVRNGAPFPPRDVICALCLAARYASSDGSRRASVPLVRDLLRASQIPAPSAPPLRAHTADTT